MQNQNVTLTFTKDTKNYWRYDIPEGEPLRCSFFIPKESGKKAPSKISINWRTEE